ncbi:unnamed protein product [marine sediment metagenome]|uniref:Uncharacterized protein n=1 Tax=marine sediment metagenome TaxID=412755 RepID=X1C8Y7_9ZZZZ
MMLKILVRGTWEIFDGFDRVSHREIPPKEDIEVRSDCYNFCEEQERSADIHPQPPMELWLYRGQQVVGQIVARRPIYILNNEGKTIERV